MAHHGVRVDSSFRTTGADCMLHALSFPDPVVRSDAIPHRDAGRPIRRARLSARAAPAGLLRDPFRLGLLALITVTLSRFGGYFGILRLMRPALLLFVFCVCYAFLHTSELHPLNLRRSWTARLLYGLVLVAVGSMAFGISLGHTAMFILDSFSKTLAITFLIMLSVRDVGDVRRLCWAFALGGIVLAYLSIFVIGISKVSGGMSYDANDVGVFMVMTLPLAVLLLQSATSVRERLIAAIGIVLLAITIVKTQSRGAFIGALAVALVMLVLPGLSMGRRLFFVAAAAVTMSLAAPPGYWIAMQGILEDPKADYNWDAVNGRRNLAKRGVGYMVAYPAFGVGLDNFRLAEGTISDKARNALPGHGVRWASPHNSFVQAGAEGGVIGLVLWASLVVSNIVLPLRLRRRMPKSWRRGTPQQRFLLGATVYLPAAQIGFAVTSFFVSFAWMEPLYFLAAIVAGLVLVTPRELRAAATGRGLDRTRTAPRTATPAELGHHGLPASIRSL